MKEIISISEKGEKLEAMKVRETEKIKDEIRTEAKGKIIKYQEESFYSEYELSHYHEHVWPK